RRGELEITDAIQWLIDHQDTVLPHVITGWWKDTGKLSDMLEANRIMLDDLAGTKIEGKIEGRTEIQGRVHVGSGSVLKDCTIRGPVVVGDGCRLERTFVGPYTSIGPGVSITGTEIEHSIVLSGSTIADLSGRIEDSLLGRNVEVRRTERFPRAYRLMLGDSSQVEIP
ncbi:MAG: glucose-1-phosphate thymidylyltransferase, partial [Cyanobacteria bacterium REEB65]|nr:glucose-1-phosphate thymidylyltransferase [Cyanobacteria bacterium REEB65]